MNEANIYQLIATLCPDGVDVKTLGEVGEFIRGNGLQKKDLIDSGIGAIHYGEVHTHYGIWATETKSFTSPELANQLRMAKTGDLVIATTSEDDDAVGKAVAWLGPGSVAVSGDAYIYRHSLEPKYVAYFFHSEHFQSQKMRHITGAKVRRLSGKNMASLSIPVPPSAIQHEIVAILDRFTALRTELAAELAARQRQYQYYRDALLTFDNASTIAASKQANVRWMALGDIAQIGTGSHDTKDAVDGGHYTFYARGRKPLRLNSYDFEETAIITAGDGVGVGKVFHWAEGKYALHQRAYRIVPHESILPRYVYHYLVANFFDYITKTSVHSSVTSLRRPMFLKLPIPLPSFAEQQKLVAILDKFDALVNDLSDGLPAEIKARRTQYEYYRDQLLSFPQNEEAA